MYTETKACNNGPMYSFPPARAKAALATKTETRLVFIDETWTKTNMTRLRGWAPKGERLGSMSP